MAFCCSMGNFSLVSSRLGMSTVVFVDKPSLACQAVTSNFQGKVIQGDLGDVSTLKQVHAHRSTGPLQITGGFACQGFSAQGDQQGTQDQRSHSLLHILQGAWYLQADDILLECVANAIHFPAAQGAIDQYAEHMGMQVSRLTFDLKDQWPVRRHRFWRHLPASWLPFIELQAWPNADDRLRLGDIMPMDAQWPPMKRSNFTGMTMNRGSFKTLPMAKTSASFKQRTQHRQCCIPGDTSPGIVHVDVARHSAHPGFDRAEYPQRLRSALCLLGQIAAPLQVLWLQAQIISGYQKHFWGWTGVVPHEQIALFKHELCLQTFTQWITPSMFLPRALKIQIEGDDQVMNIQSHTPATFHDLQTAEKPCGSWGEYVIVKHQGIRLPPTMQLFPGVIYKIQRRTPKQLKPVPLSWSIRGAGSGDADLGLGDGVLSAFMNVLKTMADSHAFFMHPFRTQHLLHLEIPEAVSASWREQSLTGDSLTICEHPGHWILLHGKWTSHGDLSWTYYDGLHPDQTAPGMLEMVAKLTSVLSERNHALTAGLSIPQTYPQTCGTIALMNLGHVLRLQALEPELDILAIHHQLMELQDTDSAPASHVYAGGDAWQSQLRELLKAKGVPPLVLEDRCQLVMSKLGANQLQIITRKKNPWVDLKAAAGKPGSMFRLVTQAELKDYIDSRAQTKHRAQLRNHKNKKQLKDQ
eukprot:Skav228268  [mRNA]  locus=scaffold778:107284:109463:- [translate_table: standard]